VYPYASVNVLGDAPAQARGALYQGVAHAAGLAAANAVANQQNGNSLALAVVTRCVTTLLGEARPAS
jgi:hypothetical protein